MADDSDSPPAEDESDRGRLWNAVEFVLDLGALVTDLF